MTDLHWNTISSVTLPTIGTQISSKVDYVFYLKMRHQTGAVKILYNFRDPFQFLFLHQTTSINRLHKLKTLELNSTLNQLLI